MKIISVLFTFVMVNKVKSVCEVVNILQREDGKLNTSVIAALIEKRIKTNKITASTRLFVDP